MRLTLEEAKTVGMMHLRLTNEMMAAAHKMVLDLQEEALRIGDIKRKDPADVPPLMLAMSILGVAHVEKDDPTFQQELGDALEVVGKAVQAWRLSKGRSH